MEKIDPDVPSDVVDRIFAAADTDGGGFITFDEFHAACSQNTNNNSAEGDGTERGVSTMLVL
eukprot:SAG31_NODE_11111_length_1065_cov_1.122153_1_plen_61_part_01